MNILEKIVESKKQEIGRLHEQHDLALLHTQLSESQKLSEGSTPRFYQALSEARAAGRPFFITEFKRKSPSEGWISRDADVAAQVSAYAQAGAGAISVLTDEPFFGGTYEDLKRASQTLSLPHGGGGGSLLLQKDFILDPIQIYLAKQYGADVILLIAAILAPERLDFLKKTAESLGMGVLVEVHDAEELAKIQHLDFPVLGINNRDLKTFRTALNRVNVLMASNGRQTTDGKNRFIIAESSVRDYRDFQVVRNADGFLIGTGLMREQKRPARFEQHFQSQGKYLFKACGIRTLETMTELSQVLTSSHSLSAPDIIGLNFSPLSKRQMGPQTFQIFKTGKISATLPFSENREEPAPPSLGGLDEGTVSLLPSSEDWEKTAPPPMGGLEGAAVAVFHKNTESEILEILEQYPFRAVQLYADDVTPEFVRRLKHRVILALQVRETADLQKLEPFATDVDFFILDGSTPGSGQRMEAAIPTNFPYPFLLAGGLHARNLESILQYDNCIGVDIASGIETDGQVNVERIQVVSKQLDALNKQRPPRRVVHEAAVS